MNMTIRSTNRRTRGTITHEATMAIVLAAAVLAGSAQTLTIVAHQRRNLDRSMMAQREVANIMEEASVIPWDKLTKGELSSLQLSTECKVVLPDAQLRIEVVESADEARQIEVEIDWITPDGQRGEPVALATWRYPGKEAN